MQRPGSPNEPAPARPATGLLREFLDVTRDFEASLRAELRVNQTDLEAMEHLIMHGPLSASELARRLGRSTAATTTAIDRLTALGHAHRERNSRDRRGIIVVPSPASRERAMGRLMPMIMAVDRALDSFDESEQRAITRYLELVVAAYRAHADSSGDEPRSAGDEAVSARPRPPR